MRPKRPTNYLAGYPPALLAQIERLREEGQLAAMLLQKYPQAHAVRTDKALYDYVQEIRSDYLRSAPQLSKVAYDSKMHVIQNVLGTHTAVSRVQGGKLKAKREIRVATVFREMPTEFLRMVVVHELAHLREFEHNKAFYQLCLHMEPEYPQLEFDLRVYLGHLEMGGRGLWG